MLHQFYIINKQTNAIQHTNDPIVASEFLTKGYIIVDTSLGLLYVDGELVQSTPVLGE